MRQTHRDEAGPREHRSIGPTSRGMFVKAPSTKKVRQNTRKSVYFGALERIRETAGAEVEIHRIHPIGTLLPRMVG